MEVWDPKKVKSPEAGHPTYHVLKCDQILKMRDYMDRRVFPPKRVTSPSWGPPPPCKQALKVSLN